MNKPELDFKSLGINTPDWELMDASENCGYEFSTPGKGVLHLKTAGVINRPVINTITHFVNNYVLKVNEKYPHQKVILIWDIRPVFNKRSIFFINSKLNFIDVFQIYFVVDSFLHRFLLKKKSQKQSFKFIQIFNNYQSSLNQANQTQDKIGKAIIFNKFHSFYSYWAQVKTTQKIDGKIWKYIELPAWQYNSEDGKCKGLFRFYENGVMYYELSGVLRGYDVNEVQRRIYLIGEDLSINFKGLNYNLVIIMNKVKYLTSDARRLLRHGELRRERLFKTIVLIAAKNVHYLVEARKKFAVNNYYYWTTARSINEAFRKILLHEQEKKQIINAPVPKEYDNLKKKFVELRDEYKKLIQQEKKNNRKIKNIISFINSGNFLNIPLQFDYSDHSLGGSLYNSLVILNNDLRNKEYANQTSGQIALSGSNIEQLLDNISEPVIIFQEKYIKYVNYSMAKLLGFTTQQINGQPISSIVDSFELNRVEKQLKEINTQQRFDCILVNFSGNPVYVSFIIDTITIDEYPAQFIFVRNDNEQNGNENLRDSNPENSQLNHQTTSLSIEQFINKSIGGTLSFFIAFNKSVNKKLLNDFVNPDSYDPQRGIQSLMVVSDFIRESVTQSYSVLKNTAAGVSNANDIIAMLFALCSDYIDASSLDVKIEVKESERVVLLCAKEAFIGKHILLQILFFTITKSNGGRMEIGYKVSEDEFVEFFIWSSISELDFSNDIEEFELSQLRLSVEDIKQTINNSSGKFFIENTQSSGSIVSMVLPIHKLVDKNEEKGE